MQLVECVPNFSEGRDQGVIQSVADAISSINGVQLLHVDSSADANRTVVTFVGEPEPVGEAAFQAISRAVELIDMRRHRGAHPRLGAADVCPFVPLAGVSIGECVRLARRVGERVGRKLAIPVYLYGAAAGSGSRSLAGIRRGEYEALPENLATPEGRPDFGPSEFNPRAGATVIGAREILIAFNVSLNTTDETQSREIARAVRERGPVRREADPADPGRTRHGEPGGAGGQVVRDSAGRAVRRSGTLKACRAIGWFMPGYGCAQVSMNLEDYRVTPPHAALEEVRHQARLRGLDVTGSELVGMIPLEAMLMAGQYYLEEAGRSPSGPAEELVATAVSLMGLSAKMHFEPEERIIEYRLRQEGDSWTEWAEQLMARRAGHGHG